MVIYKWSKFHEIHPGGETLNALFLPLNVPKANLGSVFKHSFKIHIVCKKPGDAIVAGLQTFIPIPTIIIVSYIIRYLLTPMTIMLFNMNLLGWR